MNKKANIFFGVFIALFLFIMGVLFMPFIMDDIVTARTGLSCSSTTISYGAMVTCLGIDLIVPYLIWFFCSLAVGYIAGMNK